MSTIDTALPGMTITPGATDREKLKATAKQFESMLVRQMLAAARKTDFGGDNVFGSQAMDTFNQMQDEHFADVTAESGVLGLASILEAQMQRFLPADEAAGNAANTGAANPSKGPA
ncbi:rod-binding protein [Novosphingobium sp. BL-8A]|uniref:rod-binding protein n=1 Tax=Novosphingobium sp. BL-8A TaxID=3127639 RepID=UPI003756C006